MIMEKNFKTRKTSALENMKEKSLISRRIVKDYLVSQNLKPHQVEITLEMIKAVRNASSRYRTYLEENKKLEEKEKESNSLFLLNLEIRDVEEKKRC